MFDSLYFAIASAAGSIGAVVGFGIQLRTLHKSRLEIEDLRRKAARAEQENEKLKLELQDLAHKVELTRLSREKTELEVGKLRRESAPRSPIITEVSTEEVIKFGDIRFSRCVNRFDIKIAIDNEIDKDQMRDGFFDGRAFLFFLWFIPVVIGMGIIKYLDSFVLAAFFVIIFYGVLMALWLSKPRGDIKIWDALTKNRRDL